MKKLCSMIVAAFAITACAPESKVEVDNENTVSNISAYNETKSHNNNLDCFACHREGGTGKGTFTVAGSVYASDQVKPYPNATVRLYDQPSGAGNLVATLEVDGLGNFFTTNAVSFASPLYAEVEDDGGVKVHMSTQITTGSCNSCHGTSVPGSMYVNDTVN